MNLASNQLVKTLTISYWREALPADLQTELTVAIESGQLLYFPNLAFPLTQQEQQALSPDCVSTKSKNISFDLLTDELKGLASHVPDEQITIIHNIVERYAISAQDFIHTLFPQYVKGLLVGRTSLRPVEISDRPTSYRKDDKRLHVDAFPANPNHGMRILRVFTNINPHGQPRVWKIGEPFEQVVQRFLPRLRAPIPGLAPVLNWLGITKSRRSLYDHYMLQLHDKMKADNDYQQNASQQEIAFPANTTWVVQTDQVSHAALSGQHLLEQTFYLPVESMLDESNAPLRILERLLQQPLIEPE